MSHFHDSGASTQNQGNALGSRACVRQTDTYKQCHSGNVMKDILGQSDLKWDVPERQTTKSGRATAPAPSSMGAVIQQEPPTRQPTQTQRRQSESGPYKMVNNIW
eukprot:TRINITY_DN68493_c0_g1_i1.p2 TRINITY_DN68493_c0_g1~~TRINITY_DN68493_c0_g1_i1.p2  ORF type:complete len:105 (+),score=6.31 TRINITY_DN68493_c0_g1_i1:29-343(+)